MPNYAFLEILVDNPGCMFRPKRANIVLEIDRKIQRFPISKNVWEECNELDETGTKLKIIGYVASKGLKIIAQENKGFPPERVIYYYLLAFDEDPQAIASLL